MASRREQRALKKGKDFHDLESKRKTSIQFFNSSFLDKEDSEILELKELMKEELQYATKKIGSKSIFFSWGQMERNDVLYRWQFLSNMFPCEVTIDGIVFPSTEHYFQLYPLLSHLDSPEADTAFKELMQITDPMVMRKLCKKKGKYGAVIKTFESKKEDQNDEASEELQKVQRKTSKLQVMEKALRCKMLQYPIIQELLRWSHQWQFQIVEIGSGFRTAEEPQEEDAFWNKKKWRGNWYGLNMTGKLWMKLRDELCHPLLDNNKE